MRRTLGELARERNSRPLRETPLTARATAIRNPYVIHTLSIRLKRPPEAPASRRLVEPEPRHLRHRQRVPLRLIRQPQHLPEECSCSARSLAYSRAALPPPRPWPDRRPLPRPHRLERGDRSVPRPERLGREPDFPRHISQIRVHVPRRHLPRPPFGIEPAHQRRPRQIGRVFAPFPESAATSPSALAFSGGGAASWPHMCQFSSAYPALPTLTDSRSIIASTAATANARSPAPPPDPARSAA